MKSGLVERVKCPKCQGSLFLDRDRYGWYQQCLQCGYIKNVANASEDREKVKHMISAKQEPELVKVTRQAV